MAITVQGLIDHLQEHVRLQPFVGELEVYGGFEFNLRELSGDFDIITGYEAAKLGGNPVKGLVILDME